MLRRPFPCELECADDPKATSPRCSTQSAAQFVGSNQNGIFQFLIKLH
jgi:hypothetical protein